MGKGPLYCYSLILDAFMKIMQVKGSNSGNGVFFHVQICKFAKYTSVGGQEKCQINLANYFDHVTSIFGERERHLVDM